jgi:hypothetical protein
MLRLEPMTDRRPRPGGALCARKGPAFGVRFPGRSYLAVRVSAVWVHEHGTAQEHMRCRGC